MVSTQRYNLSAGSNKVTVEWVAPQLGRKGGGGEVWWLGLKVREGPVVVGEL